MTYVGVVNEELYFLSHLAANMGTKIDEIKVFYASSYLFDLSKPTITVNSNIDAVSKK